MSVVYPVHNVALHRIEETAKWDAATHEYTKELVVGMR
jgi:hypothetical protein